MLRVYQKLIMKSLAIICALTIAWIYTTKAMWYDDDDLRAHEGEMIGINRGLLSQINIPKLIFVQISDVHGENCTI